MAWVEDDDRFARPAARQLAPPPDSVIAPTPQTGYTYGESVSSLLVDTPYLM